MIAIMGVCNAVASHDGDVLRVVFSDGREFGYLLKNKPVVTFDSEHVLIKSEDVEMTFDEYSYKDIARIDFVDSATSSIDEDLSISSYVQITYLDGENVFISGVNEKSKFNIFGLDGRQYKVPFQLNGNQLNISLAPLERGVYVIRIDNNSFKIRRK